MNWGTLALARLEKGQIYVKYISASVSAWTCFWLSTICTLLLDPGSPYDRFYIRVLNLSCTQKPARVSLSMGSLFLSFIISEQSFGTQSYKLQEYADVFIQLIQHRKTKIINLGWAHTLRFSHFPLFLVYDIWLLHFFVQLACITETWFCNPLCQLIELFFEGHYTVKAPWEQ